MAKKVDVMTKSKLLLLFGSIFFIFLHSSKAQSTIEAMRYSNTYQLGTARNVAVGGVMGGLGADFSVLSTNPAGIARYKSTEFGFTGNVVFGNTSGTYLGNTLEDNHTLFNLSHAGMVFSMPKDYSSGWKGISGGIGINRLDHYNDNIFLTGVNTNNSLLDQHASIANVAHTDPDLLPETNPFDAGLTLLGELLQVDSNFNYTSVLGDVAPEQDIIIKRRGGKYEVVLGGGGNYKDKIYIGASIGVPIINFDETVLMTEEDADNAVEGFNFFNIENRLRTTGYGVNFKAGVLTKPHKLLRLGAAFHTPTYLRVNDTYFTNVFSDFDTVAYEVESPDGSFKYNMILPWKFIANGAVLLGKYGFLGVEYELQNTSKTTLKFSGGDAGIMAEETIRNNQIGNDLDWQHHIKTGLEIKINVIRLRGGFQYKTAALAASSDHQMIYSGGIGYRGKHVFVDGAYSFSTDMTEYIPYEFENISSGAAGLEHHRSQVMITVGAKL